MFDRVAWNLDKDNSWYLSLRLIKMLSYFAYLVNVKFRYKEVYKDTHCYAQVDAQTVQMYNFISRNNSDAQIDAWTVQVNNFIRRNDSDA